MHIIGQSLTTVKLKKIVDTMTVYIFFQSAIRFDVNGAVVIGFPNVGWMSSVWSICATWRWTTLRVKSKYVRKYVIRRKNHCYTYLTSDRINPEINVDTSFHMKMRQFWLHICILVALRADCSGLNWIWKMWSAIFRFRSDYFELILLQPRKTNGVLIVRMKLEISHLNSHFAHESN